MARKDDMEALAEKKPSQGGGDGRPKGKSPTAVQKALITRNLRLAYGEVVSEPVPQRFLDLLKELGDAEETKS
jgi:hypothetical protein